jgi:hypothetical protein
LVGSISVISAPAPTAAGAPASSADSVKSRASNRYLLSLNFSLFSRIL